MKNDQPSAEPVTAPETVPATTHAKTPRQKSGPKQPKSSPRARPGTKKATILSLLKRPKGATLQELMKATQWQAHSVRGFLSGSLGKQMGVKVHVIDRDGERAYQVKA
jgi:hypothetical protein